MDIKTVFLQGKLLERQIFMKPPKEANTKKLWKLGKCVYGLNEASRYWCERVKEEFLKVGMRNQTMTMLSFSINRTNKKLVKESLWRMLMIFCMVDQPNSEM